VSITSVVCFALPLRSFDLDSYENFLEKNKSLTEDAIISSAESFSPYFSSINNTTPSYLFLDSIKNTYDLTGDEMELLKRNNFVVTERKSFKTFGYALRDIFNRDLPVFLTTDAILYTLHLSYDDILAETEKCYLQPAITKVIERMRNVFEEVRTKYSGKRGLDQNFKDVDLYLTIASSLIDSVKKTPIIASSSSFNSVWNAITQEKYIEMPLFSTLNRRLDFSQFAVRGHYVRKKLGPYFRTMMWLGRTEFLITAPRQGKIDLAEKEDLQRMTIDAVLLSEILECSGAKADLVAIDSILSFIVGESDNCTPKELTRVMNTLGFDDAAAILDTKGYDSLANALSAAPEAGQKILSQVIILDPCNTDTLKLPVSFLLLGQRFIVDSYVFSNVIYDKTKTKRMMPDPLDVAYALGNDDAVPLLQSELQQWHYAPQLEKIRFLVDAYDDTFWTGSLYNIWLATLKTLNPSTYPDAAKQPLFMRTAAWHQEKLNTQLASWAQLRHDNLLYVKQSYTPGIGCSYPHGYVEPYPEFYRTIGTFASRASQIFRKYNTKVTGFYSKVSMLMDTLTSLAEKEIAQQPFTSIDSAFMANMLVSDHVCGAPIVQGWFASLIYHPDRATDLDYTIVDVHTQPTDAAGNMVGKVLHVGVGKVDLGVFLAQSPSAGFAPMAYVGPVSSYYQKITSNFKRLTDEEWRTTVRSSHETLPQRPDWINSYCADKDGSIRSQGRGLKGIPFSGGVQKVDYMNMNRSVNPVNFSIHPWRGTVNVTLNIRHSSQLTIKIFDTLGRLVAKQIDHTFGKGNHTLSFPLCPGAYTFFISSEHLYHIIPLLIVQ
jgi:hypothetical protein